jgi:hypothetical protein
MDLQESPDDKALPATPGETRVGPYGWAAAGAIISAVLWLRLLSLGVIPHLPEWLVEGLTAGVIVGFACGFMSWEGRRDQAMEGVRTGALIFCCLLATNFLFDLARS